MIIMGHRAPRLQGAGAVRPDFVGTGAGYPASPGSTATLPVVLFARPVPESKAIPMGFSCCRVRCHYAWQVLGPSTAAICIGALYTVIRPSLPSAQFFSVPTKNARFLLLCVPHAIEPFSSSEGVPQSGVRTVVGSCRSRTMRTCTGQCTTVSALCLLVRPRLRAHVCCVVRVYEAIWAP